jgi:hypothetical protein
MNNICPKCGQVIRKKRWIPPTLDEVKAYWKANPELANVDPYLFWRGFQDGGWIDTQGRPVRNWKLKMRTWSSHKDPVKAKYTPPPKRAYKPYVAPVKQATPEEIAAIRAASPVFAPKPAPPPIDIGQRKAELLKQLGLKQK